MSSRHSLGSCVALLALSCGSTAVDGASNPPNGDLFDVEAGDDALSRDLSTDVLHTSLDLDVSSRSGQATVTVARRTKSVALRVGDLSITSVSSPACGPLTFRVRDRRLDIALPRTGPCSQGDEVTVTVEYSFSVHGSSDGLSSKGSTVTWPYFCENLFPCNPKPSDGSRFSLSLRGVPDGKRAIYPSNIASDAPAYMLAFAVGAYEEHKLGETRAKTVVSVFPFRGESRAALEATRSLTRVVDWLETTIGPYRFGSNMASVAADWGNGAYGGMEHHPYFHVGSSAMGDAHTHHHEAVHGWFGNGVRIACWEDFVLSEGTTDYLAARAIEALDGEASGARIFAEYERELENVTSEQDTVALPDNTCNKIDILHHPLWSTIPYKRGALFYRDVAKEIGAERLDLVLAQFYRTYGGKSARMQDMLAMIECETGFSPAALANKWLRSKGTSR